MFEGTPIRFERYPPRPAPIIAARKVNLIYLTFFLTKKDAKKPYNAQLPRIAINGQICVML